ncbi:MAG: lasso peptide biosynthesis B2 protein [Deltaproteobacteria bacterium]|nr:lasso peptide biosynthesis B2 protein [Deltaproteobacteria bacterium]
MPGRGSHFLKSLKRAGLACEAYGFLVIARGTLIILPFRMIAPRLSHSAKIHDQAAVAWIAAWVEACAHKLPWQTKCLEQAIAAKLMLRRRGISNKLYLGVKQQDGEMKAHAWLEGEKAEDYVQLQCFEDYIPSRLSPWRRPGSTHLDAGLRQHDKRKT